MFVQIGVFIMAVAFALISIFIAKILLRISGVIGTIGQSASTVESKIDKTISELEQTIVGTAVTASDIEEKSLALTSVFQTVKNIGDTSALVSESVVERTARYDADQSMPGAKPFVRIIQVSEFASSLLNSWGKGKKVGTKF